MSTQDQEGTASDTFEIGFLGIVLKKISTSLLGLFESDGTTKARLRILDPINADEAATKSYVDAAGGVDTKYVSISLMQLSEDDIISTGSTTFVIFGRSFLHNTGLGAFAKAFVYVLGKSNDPSDEGRWRLEAVDFTTASATDLGQADIVGDNLNWTKTDITTALAALADGEYILEFQARKVNNNPDINTALLVIYK